MTTTLLETPAVEIGEFADRLLIADPMVLDGKRGHNPHPIHCFFCVRPTPYVVALGNTPRPIPNDNVPLILDSVRLHPGDPDSRTEPVICDDCRNLWPPRSVAAIIVERMSGSPQRQGQVAFLSEAAVAAVVDGDADLLDRILDRRWCYLRADRYAEVLATGLPPDIEEGQLVILTHEHKRYPQGLVCDVLNVGDRLSRCRTPFGVTIFPSLDYLRVVREAE